MSEELLIKNGMIVTGDKNGTVIQKGYIKVNGPRIAEISEGDPKFSADTVIDANGCVVIPGLITAHTHLYGILLRGASLNIEPPTDFARHRKGCLSRSGQQVIHKDNITAQVTNCYHG